MILSPLDLASRSITPFADLSNICVCIVYNVDIEAIGCNVMHKMNINKNEHKFR